MSAKTSKTCAPVAAARGRGWLVALLLVGAVAPGVGCHEDAQASADRHAARAQASAPAVCSPDFMGILRAVDAQRAPGPTAQRFSPEAPMAKLREAARARAENWVELADYAPASSGDVRAKAVLSYPQSDTSLARRSYIYDDALAILWFSWTGQFTKARAIAQTLYYLQKPDGSWGFSFNVDHPEDYHARYVRSGTVAWAAHALAYFGAQYADPAALLSAQRATRFLQAMRIGGSGLDRGLVSAGLGIPSTLPDAPPSPKIEFAAAEHQFDAQLVLARFEPMAAERLAERMIEVLWRGQEGRFALAARADAVDARRALDAAGAWGALWLLSNRQPERARRSYEYALKTFATTAVMWDERGDAPRTLKLHGFRPYEDAIDNYDVLAEPGHFFVEGTMSMGLAAHRLGDAETAEKLLRTGIALSCADGPGLPYSNVSLPGFSTHPAAASTLWFLFLEREMASGQSAPIFPIQPSLTARAEPGREIL